MKKILLTITLTAIAFCANAKTAEELANEYGALRASGQDYHNASQSVYEANRADVIAIFATWKNSTQAKFEIGEAPCKDFTDAQKKQSYAIRAIMSRYIIDNLELIAQMHARVAFITVPLRVNPVMSVENPNWYSELKAVDFVVDGLKLPAYTRICLAHTVKDTAYISSLPIEEGMAFPNVYITQVLNDALEASDIEASKDKLRSLENFIIRRNIESKYLSRIQAVGKVLTARLVDKKISGK